MSSFEFDFGLPGLGKRSITPDSREPGHYLWLDSFGWHDCSPKEDAMIHAARDAEKQGSVA